MMKGLFIAVLAVLFLSTIDRFVSNGRYTDATIAMSKQIAAGFGFRV